MRLNLPQEEINRIEEFWNNVDPLQIDNLANELVQQIIDKKQVIDDFKKEITQLTNLLLYYRAEHTDVNDSVHIQGKNLILRSNNDVVLNLTKLNEVEGIPNFLNSIVRRIQSYNESNLNYDIVKKLLDNFPKKQKEQILLNWKNQEIITTSTKYDLVIK